MEVDLTADATACRPYWYVFSFKFHVLTINLNDLSRYFRAAVPHNLTAILLAWPCQCVFCAWSLTRATDLPYRSQLYLRTPRQKASQPRASRRVGSWSNKAIRRSSGQASWRRYAYCSVLASVGLLISRFIADFSVAPGNNKTQ